MKYTKIDQDTAEETTITTVCRTKEELLSHQNSAQSLVVYWQERLVKINAILEEMEKE